MHIFELTNGPLCPACGLPAETDEEMCESCLADLVTHLFRARKDFAPLGILRGDYIITNRMGEIVSITRKI